MVDQRAHRANGGWHARTTSSMPTRLGRAWALAIAALILPGCSSKTDPAHVGHGLPDTSSSRQGPAPSVGRCELNQVIRYPDSDKPEWVIHELFSAALSEEPEEKSFKRFARVFSDVHRESWVREAYWSAAKKHVRTYVSESSGDWMGGLWYSGKCSFRTNWHRLGRKWVHSTQNCPRNPKKGSKLTKNAKIAKNRKHVPKIGFQNTISHPVEQIRDDQEA